MEILSCDPDGSPTKPGEPLKYGSNSKGMTDVYRAVYKLSFISDSPSVEDEQTTKGGDRRTTLERGVITTDAGDIYFRDFAYPSTSRNQQASRSKTIQRRQTKGDLRMTAGNKVGRAAVENEADNIVQDPPASTLPPTAINLEHRKAKKQDPKKWERVANQLGIVYRVSNSSQSRLPSAGPLTSTPQIETEDEGAKTPTEATPVPTTAPPMPSYIRTPNRQTRIQDNYNTLSGLRLSYINNRDDLSFDADIPLEEAEARLETMDNLLLPLENRMGQSKYSLLPEEEYEAEEK